MPRKLTIHDVRPVALTIWQDDQERIMMEIRYERLDEKGEAIPGFQASIRRELKGMAKQKVANFIQNTIKPLLRQEEKIT